jgi:putative membrane protein
VSKQDNRWPQSLYGIGGEPDPRFTLANERTFLAWIRTSIAIMAIGVAINELQVGANAALRSAVVILLIVAGVALAGFSYLRWMKIEKSMRQTKPLPSLVSGLGLVIVLVFFALLVGLLTVS